jgi:hypothetical protein
VEILKRMQESLKPMLETTYDGEDLPHRLMWAIVEEQVELAKTREDWSIPSLIAMVFAFHAMEACRSRCSVSMLRIFWPH